MMDDLIKRQVAIDALDKEYRCTDHTDDWDGLKTAMLIIENLPSALPEVIRCKDCRYKELKGVDYFCDHITGEEIMVSPNEYCSWAERGTDG